MIRIAMLGLMVVAPLLIVAGVSAEARIVFHLRDDAGAPVDTAKVNVFFDMADRSKGVRVVSHTDTNGICEVVGQTRGVIEVSLEKEGYYRSKGEICLISQGDEHAVSMGRWQPWPLRKDMVLPKVRNPEAVRTERSGWLVTKQLNRWVGFDVRAHDYVAPWGKGCTADFEVMFDWDGVVGSRYNGMTLRMRFPEKNAGGYWQNRYLGSDILGVYNADPHATYVSEFSWSEVVERDAHGRARKWNRRLFDSAQVLVCRSRCRLDEKGKLERACYFQVSNLEFACDTEGVAMRFVSAYNPLPNGVNLECSR